MVMPTADELHFAADMMRSNAESELTDDTQPHPDDAKAARCEMAIAEFFLNHHGKPDHSAGLLAEMRDTAAWLDERAGLLLKLLADPAGWGRGQAATDKREAIRAEAARYRGRAAVIRQTILKATAGG